MYCDKATLARPTRLWLCKWTYEITTFQRNTCEICRERNCVLTSLVLRFVCAFGMTFQICIAFTSWTRIEMIKLNVGGTSLSLYALLLSLSLALLIYISLNICIYLTQNGKHEKFKYHSGITLQSTKNKKKFQFY